MLVIGKYITYNLYIVFTENCLKDEIRPILRLVPETK